MSHSSISESLMRMEVSFECAFGPFALEIALPPMSIAGRVCDPTQR